MFLALKEIRYSKLRYGLIVGIIFLIAYVVFMLSGLATGLAQEFKMAIEDWDASEIVLSEEANKTFAASQLTRQDLERVEAKEKAPVGLYSGTVVKGDDKVNVAVFGTTEEAFILPKIIKGEPFSGENEIVISENLAEKGFKIGDTVDLGNLKDVTIVGISPESYYTVSPVVYTSLDTWTKMKFGDQPFASTDDKPLNAIVVKGTDATLASDANLEKMSISTFIENMPGYSAQNLTLNAMIYFLFVVAAAVIGIFMYVITLQKEAIFGVMKAQGISSGFIAKSIIAQSFIVGIIGTVIAFGLAFLTSLILPDAMPFYVALDQWGLYSLIILLVAIIGGLFSIRTVTKVDPITAIGGE